MNRSGKHREVRSLELPGAQCSAKLKRFMGVRCLGLAPYEIVFPGKWFKDGQRQVCRAPRCSAHAQRYAKLHDLVLPTNGVGR